jgi:hypothetical protein
MVRRKNTSSPVGAKSSLSRAKRSAREGKPLFQVVARIGYAARGLVYSIVGLVAISVAFGIRNTALSLTSVLQELLGQPLGTIVVWGIAAGMVCCAFWRLAQGLLDADRLGSGRRAVFRRIAYVLSSLAYFGLAALAIGVAFQVPPSGSSPRGWAAWIIGWPLGPLALGLIGTGFLGLAATTALRAYRAPFKQEFELRSSIAKWLVPMGRAGHSARSIIFLIIGYFLISSAVHSNVREVRDMAGALNALQGQQFGMVLYTAVAAGLSLFGVFEFIQAFFRKVGHHSYRSASSRT